MGNGISGTDVPTLKLQIDDLMDAATLLKKITEVEDPLYAVYGTSGGYPITEPIPNYNKSAGDMELRSKKVNARIIIGRDKPGSDISGAPGTGTGCIDLVVGLSGNQPKMVNEEGKETTTNRSTALDSARIYITQRAKDIDSEEYFNLASGKYGVKSGRNKSAIVIKADSVRAISRYGIKLVTGTDSFDGGSGKNISAVVGGIDLIAGNNAADLQPMVKANDLEYTLDQMLKLISDLHSVVAYVINLIVSIGKTMLAGPAAALTAAELASTVSQLVIQVTNLSLQEKNLASVKNSYKNPMFEGYFKSHHCRVN